MSIRLTAYSLISLTFFVAHFTVCDGDRMKRKSGVLDATSSTSLGICESGRADRRRHHTNSGDAFTNSGDVYEQGVVKTFAGFFRGNSKHLFGVTPSGRQ